MYGKSENTEKFADMIHNFLNKSTIKRAITRFCLIPKVVIGHKRKYLLLTATLQAKRAESSQ